MEKFYITTAIDYVNGLPHIGHAYEKIASDVLSRHFKQRQIDVFFLTGSDEHGIKIEKTAKSKNIEPKEHCDLISQEFKNAWKAIDIDYDRYIRTTDKDHEKVVQWAFQELINKGDIYKDSYTGLYCNGCEAFLSPRDLTEEGLCPQHLEKPCEVNEENYFFRLSKYKDRIIEHIKNNPKFILPEFRATEILNQLENIQDVSVTRSRNSVNWGIPVPGDDEQVIYVWIDALTNYITGAGILENKELFNKYWPADVHMIGKDILKFHSIYWIAFLMALEIELPKTIFAHGWITIDETKMSNQ
jgi:methionyl-tRNA synthetase